MRHIEIKRGPILVMEDLNVLLYKYPLKYAGSRSNPDVSVVILDRLNEKQIPPGTYHFNHISCTCLVEKKSLFDRIQSIVRKNLPKTQLPSFLCELHSFNPNIILKSNNFFGNTKKTAATKSSSNFVCYHYPLNYAASEQDCDISLIITESSDQNHIPQGSYYFNHINCTCPREKTGLLHRIQSLFKKKSSQSWSPVAPCNLHSLNHDVLLQFYDLKI